MTGNIAVVTKGKEGGRVHLQRGSMRVGGGLLCTLMVVVVIGIYANVKTHGIVCPAPINFIICKGKMFLNQSNYTRM